MQSISYCCTLTSDDVPANCTAFLELFSRHCKATNCTSCTAQVISTASQELFNPVLAFQTPKKLQAHYVCLQALVNNSVNMAEQLYCSKIHSKNIKICLSKLASLDGE